MIELEVQKLEIAKKRFKEMQERAKNPRHVMDVMGAKAYREVIQNFDKEKNEDGTAWAKWKDPKTGQRVGTRPYGRGGNKLLRDTGYLRYSIRWIASKLEARVFTKVNYAKYHQYGKDAMKRQFMWISDKLRLQFAMEILEYIRGR